MWHCCLRRRLRMCTIPCWRQAAEVRIAIMHRAGKHFLKGLYFSSQLFEAALIYDETNDEAAYYLGLCRQENDTAAAAAAYYEDFLIKFPQSGFAADVTARLAQLRTQLPQEQETSADNQENGQDTADDGTADNEEQPVSAEETQGQ